MADVYSTLNTIAPYFVPFLVIVFILVLVNIFTGKKGVKISSFIKKESFIAAAIALIVTMNMVFMGPLFSVLNLALSTGGEGISQELTDSSSNLTLKIAEEGTVLLKNSNSLLPLSDSVNRLNVFGWASTNPCYGGTGSGAVDTTTCTDILTSLEDSGYELNMELSSFYREYRADRPLVGLFSQDWTLPEPMVSEYTDSMLEKAQNFSDYALIVLSRVGGEGADLPKDLLKVTYNGNPGDFDAGQTYLELSKTEEDMISMVTSKFDNVIVLINTANAMQLDWIDSYDSIKGVLLMSGPGQVGFGALGKILSGEVNPSGKTVDTFVNDLTENPSFNNMGNFKYDNLDEHAYHSINYYTKEELTETAKFCKLR